jgi:tryptophan synthase alpha chain
LPVAVGFGISTPAQAAAAAKDSDAVVVGSAIVNQIAKLGKDPQMVKQLSKFVAPMVKAVHAL